MGNFLSCSAVALCSSPQESELGSLVSQMREAMNNFDGNFVQSLQGDEELTKICEPSKEMHDTFSRAASDGGLDNTCFSSWCTLVCTYDVDFGWGKPMWVSCVGATLQTMLHSPCT